MLPGAGATIASFLAYGAERTFASAKEKLKFGKGSIRAVNGTYHAFGQKLDIDRGRLIFDGPLGWFIAACVFAVIALMWRAAICSAW